MFLEELIIKRMKELHPSFDYKGAEHKMYTVLYEDAINYFKYIWKLDNNLDAKKAFTDRLVDEGLKAKEEFDAWITFWYKVWRKRVKIFFNEEEFNRNSRQVQRLIRRGLSSIGYQEFKSIKWPIIEALIMNGILCFTNVLAEQTIMQELGKKKWNIRSVEGKLNFINHVMKRIRTISNTAGPLIFLRVGDVYGK